MSLSGGLPNGMFADAGDTPGLLFSGTADPIVPFAWSGQTAGALLNAGVPAFLESWDGAGHDPYLQFQSQIDSQSDYFFYDFLDAAHAQGSPASAAHAFDREIRQMRARYPRFARKSGSRVGAPVPSAALDHRFGSLAGKQGCGSRS